MDWTVLLVAAVAAAGSAFATISQWRQNKQQARHVEVDAQGEIIDDLHDHIEWQRAERSALIEKLEEVREEMHPNGGKSLRDAVDRIEVAQREHAADVAGRFEHIESRLDDIEAA